jgi:hypothetical protein
LTCEVLQNEDELIECNTSLNTFQVMMAAAANEVGKNVPKQIESPKNGLDQLFNCILSHLSSSGCIFPKNVGPACGTFVDTDKIVMASRWPIRKDQARRTLYHPELVLKERK